jgi:hypothetical protein
MDAYGYEVAMRHFRNIMACTDPNQLSNEAYLNSDAPAAIFGQDSIVLTLSPIHFAILVTIYCHMLLFGQLPAGDITYAPPNDFVVIPRLFAICTHVPPMGYTSGDEVIQPQSQAAYDILMSALRYLGSVTESSKEQYTRVRWAYFSLAHNCVRVIQTWSLSSDELSVLLTEQQAKWGWCPEFTDLQTKLINKVGHSYWLLTVESQVYCTLIEIPYTVGG